MPQTIWNGSLRFGLIEIPVNLFAAERPAAGLPIQMLDGRDMEPVAYRRVNRRTGEVVPWEAVVRGYEYEAGRYVVVTDEDLERADPEATRAMELVAFVEPEAIEPPYYDTPYYLVPSEAEAASGYALLREALRRSGKVGIAKLVLRTRQHLAAVLVRGSVLVLELLRYAAEVREARLPGVPGEDLESLGLTPAEVELAGLLVERMTESWDPGAYRDDYRDEVLAALSSKATGARQVPAQELPLAATAAAVGSAANGGSAEAAETPPVGVVDRIGLLEQSLERAVAGERRPARRGRRALGEVAARRPA